MKLNPEELTVSTFETSGTSPDVIIAPTTDPTAQTNCYWCPPQSADCY